MKQSNKGQTIILASLWNRSCINLDNIGQILYTLRSCTCCCRSLRFFQRQRRDWWWPTLGQKWRESGRAAWPVWVQQFSMSLMGHPISFLHERCLMKQSNKGQTIVLVSLWNSPCINLDNIGQILSTVRSCACCCRRLRFFPRQRRDWWWPTLGQKCRQSVKAARPELSAAI